MPKTLENRAIPTWAVVAVPGVPYVSEPLNKVWETLQADGWQVVDCEALTTEQVAQLLDQTGEAQTPLILVHYPRTTE